MYPWCSGLPSEKSALYSLYTPKVERRGVGAPRPLPGGGSQTTTLAGASNSNPCPCAEYFPKKSPQMSRVGRSRRAVSAARPFCAKRTEKRPRPFSEFRAEKRRADGSRDGATPGLFRRSRLRGTPSESHRESHSGARDIRLAHTRGLWTNAARAALSMSLTSPNPCGSLRAGSPPISRLRSRLGRVLALSEGPALSSSQPHTSTPYIR